MKKAPNRQGIEIPFYKIQGAGNDCIVFESKYLEGHAVEKVAFVKAISDRNLGIGSDQILELVSRDPLSILIWNRDGSRAEMCANGTRSFAMLADQEGWIDHDVKKFSLQVTGKSFECIRQESGFELCLGEPKLEGKFDLATVDKSIPYYRVNVGNPHAVIFARGLPGDWQIPSNWDFHEWGARIEQHPDFRARTNVEFIRELTVTGKEARLKIEVWERGAGATLSCGTGAVAVAKAVRVTEPNIDFFQITMNQFTLTVRFEGERAYLSGPSKLVAKGAFYY